MLVAICAKLTTSSADEINVKTLTGDRLSRYLMEHGKLEPAHKACVRFGIGLLHVLGQNQLSEHTMNVEDNVIDLLEQLQEPDLIGSIKMTKRLETIISDYSQSCLDILGSGELQAHVKPRAPATPENDHDSMDNVEDFVEEIEMPKSEQIEEPTPFLSSTRNSHKTSFVVNNHQSVSNLLE